MDALAALVKLQQSATTGLVRYDKARLATELELFPDWYAARYRGQPWTRPTGPRSMPCSRP